MPGVVGGSPEATAVGGHSPGAVTVKGWGPCVVLNREWQMGLKLWEDALGFVGNRHFDSE